MHSQYSGWSHAPSQTYQQVRDVYWNWMQKPWPSVNIIRSNTKCTNNTRGNSCWTKRARAQRENGFEERCAQCLPFEHIGSGAILLYYLINLLPGSLKSYLVRRAFFRDCVLRAKLCCIMRRCRWGLVARRIISLRIIDMSIWLVITRIRRVILRVIHGDS